MNHKAEEYARHDKFGALVTTNTVEGFSEQQACDRRYPYHISGQHTDLYYAELDYKYNTRDETDGERTIGAIQKVRGSGLCIGSW